MTSDTFNLFLPYLMNLMILQENVDLYILVSGGTIGLFTGTSLLSFVEILYWTFLALLNIVTKMQAYILKECSHSK